MSKEVRWLIEEKYRGERSLQAEYDIARLAGGEHVDYVIGWVSFAGCKIDLSERPLIPRPETEYWAMQAIEEIRTIASRRPFVLDMFAGSGCIGLAILRHVPDVRVDFAEKEKRFLKQIEKNARLNGIKEGRYRVLQSDIFSGVKERYDYILANPPYVAEGRKGAVQQSVLDEEPYHAVFGGADGLRYTRAFLTEVKTYLLSRGVVYLEFDSYQKAEIENIASKNGALKIEIRKDQFGNWRYARMSF